MIGAIKRRLPGWSKIAAKVETGDARRWNELPVQRRRLAAAFRQIPDEVLNVCGFDVPLRKAIRASSKNVIKGAL